MHEKGNCKAKLIVGEWKSGLKEVVSDCKCKGRDLMVLLRTARGTKIDLASPLLGLLKQTITTKTL